MKSNMGRNDRVLRILLVVLVGILYFMEIISGTVAIVLGIISAIFILNSMIGFCPLYAPFQLSTRKRAV